MTMKKHERTTNRQPTMRGIVVRKVVGANKMETKSKDKI
jgi:hypothetical protein